MQVGGKEYKRDENVNSFPTLRMIFLQLWAEHPEDLPIASVCIAPNCDILGNNLCLLYILWFEAYFLSHLNTLKKLGFFFFFFCWSCHMACGISVAQWGTEPEPWQGKRRVLTIGVHAKLLQSCPTLCDPMDYSPPGPGNSPEEIFTRQSTGFPFVNSISNKIILRMSQVQNKYILN